MKRFELPVVDDQISVADAIEEMIEAGTSGLLVRNTVRELRIVDFDRAVNAHERGVIGLHELESQPALDLEANAARSNDAAVENALHAAGQHIAFFGVERNKAQMFSISEETADILAAVSSGVHCQRPNPPTTGRRQWYHYYPPLNRDVSNPHTCRVCGSYVP